LDLRRALFFIASCLIAADPHAASVARKLDIIQGGKAKPGAVYVFPVADLNAWVRAKVPEVTPQGVREPRLELGNNTATAYAFVDFVKLRKGAGEETSWFVAKLIEGEKPVKVMARFQSAHGAATVFLQRVEIGGLKVSGATLDFLIHTFFMPLYPNAKIDEPFELADRIDHIEVTPAEARVCIRK